jgi:hypothetical protein
MSTEIPHPHFLANPHAHTIHTQQDYFEKNFKSYLNGPLKFPTLPTINFGSATRTDLIPAELGKSFDRPLSCVVLCCVLCCAVGFSHVSLQA